MPVFIILFVGLLHAQSNVIKGLEQRVLQLTDNVDRTVTRCRTLEKEKGELCDQVDVTMVTFVEQQQKYEILDYIVV